MSLTPEQGGVHIGVGRDGDVYDAVNDRWLSPTADSRRGFVTHPLDEKWHPTNETARERANKLNDMEPWAYSIEAAIKDRMNGHGIMARLSAETFESYICTLLSVFEEARKRQ